MRRRPRRRLSAIPVFVAVVAVTVAALCRRGTTAVDAFYVPAATATATATAKKGLGMALETDAAAAASAASEARSRSSAAAAARRDATMVTVTRVGGPAVFAAASAAIVYTPLSYLLASGIDSAGVFGVVSQDSSQYIQNILTTCGLMFSILVGQTYYFMYQQQEAVYYALFEEVTVAKSLLEQLALVSQGRGAMYAQILSSVERYVDHDLRRITADPAVLLSARPEDDPLETVMYLTSVGEPGIVYDTVRALRQARARRLGALQTKLPPLQMVLLWTLAAIVLATFPLLGAGSQTIGGLAILKVQSAYISFIVFGIVAILRVIDELRKPGAGAYNVDSVLDVMVTGLEDELHGRLEGRYGPRMNAAPTVDTDRALAIDGGDDDDNDIEAAARRREEEVDAAMATTARAMGRGVGGNIPPAPGNIGAEAEAFAPDDGSFIDGLNEADPYYDVRNDSDDDGSGAASSSSRKRLFRWLRRCKS